MKTHWEKILDLDFYTEGPALDKEGNLYFTTLTGGTILKYDIQRRLTRWSDLKCPNGQRILENGHHLVCDTQDRSIVELDSAGEIVGYKARLSCAQRPFRSPNDLTVDTNGGVYFTDSTRHHGQVFYIDPLGRQFLVEKDLDYPNGIALSPDGSRIYIAESINNRILVGELEEPGMLRSPFEVFVNLHENPLPKDPARLPYTANLPDGLACDPSGRIWVAHYGMGVLQLIGSDGIWIQSIATGIPATSNLIMDPTGSVAYVTGGTGEPGPGCVHKIYLQTA